MEIVAKSFFLLVVGVSASIICGYGCRKILKTNNIGIVNDLLVGLFFLFAVFEVECVISVYIKLSLQMLCVIFGVSVAILCLIGIGMIIYSKDYLFNWDGYIFSKINWGLVFSICLISFQTIMLAFSMKADADDASYVAISTTALETNTLLEYSQYTGEYVDDVWGLFKRALSPFSLFVAVISFFFQIHPAITSHTILPIVLLPLAYIIYWQLSRNLLSNFNERVLFLFFLCLLNVYGAYSAYPASNFLLTRIWQGKAIYAAIVIPWVIYCLICVREDKSRYSWANLFISSVAGILFSNVAVVGNILLVFAYIIIDYMDEKKWRTLLYGAIMCIPMLICGIIILFSMYMM